MATDLPAKPLLPLDEEAVFAAEADLLKWRGEGETAARDMFNVKFFLTTPLPWWGCPTPVPPVKSDVFTHSIYIKLPLSPLYEVTIRGK